MAPSYFCPRLPPSGVAHPRSRTNGERGVKMRILIIGGGMAGWTLAGLLRARGLRVTLIERVERYSHAGFGIGLYPFSANTLRETGVY